MQISRLSNLTNKRVAECLQTRDHWNKDEVVDYCVFDKMNAGRGGLRAAVWSPPKKLQAAKASEQGRAQRLVGVTMNRPWTAGRPSDLSRLIAMVFSEEFWKEVCRSEEGSSNRSANKNESDLLKNRHPVCRNVAAAYLDPGWKDQGSFF